jgi:hypothetical protein
MMNKEQKEMVKAKYDHVKFHRDGSATVMRGYFYRIVSVGQMVEVVMNNFPDAKIVDSGDHYHDFVGGAEVGSAKSSYRWVRFTFQVMR